MPDQLIRLRNMQLVQLKTPEDYVAKSQITQFVSTNDNIGNYMPVLAIQEMLGEETDCWNIHRTIDWDFVNANYRFAVIGGAGLLHKTFTNFWSEFAMHCTVPYVIWGVGICEVDGQAEPTYCSPEIAGPVFAKALAVNVRDERTASLYAGGGLGADGHAGAEAPARSYIDISECPTVFYLRAFETTPETNRATLAMHPDLVSDADHEQARKTLHDAGFQVQVTDNVQTAEHGLVEIIETDYAKSALVVTSRLHGAITAYGLGIPYIAIAGDEKLREFVRLYGRGDLVDSVSALPEALERIKPVDGRPPFAHIEAFGKRVLALV